METEALSHFISMTQVPGQTFTLGSSCMPGSKYQVFGIFSSCQPLNDLSRWTSLGALSVLFKQWEERPMSLISIILAKIAKPYVLRGEAPKGKP